MYESLNWLRIAVNLVEANDFYLDRIAAVAGVFRWQNVTPTGRDGKVGCSGVSITALLDLDGRLPQLLELAASVK